MATVTIPLLFKDLTGGVRRAEVEGATVAEIVASLESRFPGMEARIRQGNGLSPNVVITVDGQLAARGLHTPVGPKSQINLLPAMGGG